MQQPQAVSVSSPFQSWRASWCYKSCSFAHLHVSKASCTQCTRVQQTNLHALQFRHRASSLRSCCAFLALGTFAHSKAHSEASRRQACNGSRAILAMFQLTTSPSLICSHSPQECRLCPQHFVNSSWKLANLQAAVSGSIKRWPTRRRHGVQQYLGFARWLPQPSCNFRRSRMPG